MSKAGSGFENPEVFTGTRTGKQREEWVTNVNRILFSSGLERDAWANKVLTYVKGTAAELFKKDPTGAPAYESLVALSPLQQDDLQVLHDDEAPGLDRESADENLDLDSTELRRRGV